MEQYSKQGKLVPDYDLDLKINFLEFQIDKSLEIRDKELFLQYTKELKEVHVLKMKMENFYENKEVMNYR